MIMSATILETGKITSKGQTTVPKSVRLALDLSAGDTITYCLANGTVTLVKADEQDDDPAIGAFLSVLERDIASGRNVGDLPEDLAATLRRCADMDVDLDVPIDGDTVL
jgi:antitoxin PrlF